MGYDIRKTVLLQRLTSTWSTLKTAQLREVLRLTRSGEDKDRADALRGSLQEAGIDVDRARKVLARELNANFAFEKQRDEDLALIDGEKKRDKRRILAIRGVSALLVL